MALKQKLVSGLMTSEDFETLIKVLRIIAIKSPWKGYGRNSKSSMRESFGMLSSKQKHYHKKDNNRDSNKASFFHYKRY